MYIKDPDKNMVCSERRDSIFPDQSFRNGNGMIRKQCSGIPVSICRTYSGIGPFRKLKIFNCKFSGTIPKAFWKFSDFRTLFRNPSRTRSGKICWNLFHRVSGKRFRMEIRTGIPVETLIVRLLNIQQGWKLIRYVKNVIDQSHYS